MTKKKCPHCGSEKIKHHKFVDGDLWICHGCGKQLTEEINLEKKEGDPQPVTKADKV